MIYKTKRVTEDENTSTVDFFKRFTEYDNKTTLNFGLSNFLYVTLTNVDLITKWQEDRSFLLPSMPRDVQSVQYLITPHNTKTGYRRTFALFRYDNNKALACEIPLVIMLIAPSKVCDIAGSTFENAVVSNDVWTIDDSDIKMVFIDNKNNNYIALQSNDKKLTFEIGSSLFAGINMNTHENLLRNVGLLF